MVTCFQNEDDQAEEGAPANISNTTSIARGAKFFGRSPQLLVGKMQSWEFLQSITDSQVLVRDGQSFYTQNFIDPMTSAVSVVMTTFAPQYGIASILTINADFSSNVRVDYEVSHFQTLEGSKLEMYRATIILGIVLAVVIAIEKVWTLRNKSWSEEKVGFMVDIIIQVVLPIAYFVIRYTQVSSSKEAMHLAMGEPGLMGVPWDDNTIQPDVKIREFFHGLESFQRLVDIEFVMSLFYFAHATVALLRLLVQTGAHPRLSILVGTFLGAADDLWHFLLLLMIVMGGFLALAMAQFSGEREYFRDVGSCFETLYGFMLGNLPPDGENASENWSSNPLVFAFVILYHVVVFMVMLNFIIAIIVIAHQDVWTKVREMESDQEFFLDVFSILEQVVKSQLYRWPSHLRLIEGFGNENCALVNIQYVHIRRMFPQWRSRNSIIQFIQYYGRFTPKIKEEDEVVSQFKLLFGGHEERISVMFGVPIPSEWDRIFGVYELKKRQGTTKHVPLKTIQQKEKRNIMVTGQKRDDDETISDSTVINSKESDFVPEPPPRSSARMVYWFVGILSRHSSGRKPSKPASITRRGRPSGDRRPPGFSSAFPSIGGEGERECRYTYIFMFTHTNAYVHTCKLGS